MGTRPESTTCSSTTSAKEFTIGRRGEAVAAALDVVDADAVEELVARVEEEHGPLDLMVNNAGIGVAGPAETLTLEHWQRSRWFDE